MANYHLEVDYVSRKYGGSPAAKIAYQRGEKIRDNYFGKIYDYRDRQDVLHAEICLPPNAPFEYIDPQRFADEVDRAEKRWDSRTLREIIASLPNEPELELRDYIDIIKEYIVDNFIGSGMGACVAIHKGENKNPEKNNPHVHILLTTRAIGSEGFSPKKNRDWDKRANVRVWREQWARVQNRAYERKGLNIRVSHESYIMQDKEREARKYLSRWDYELEQRSIHTIRGDDNRKIEIRNRENEERSYTRNR